MLDPEYFDITLLAFFLKSVGRGQPLSLPSDPAPNIQL